MRRPVPDAGVIVPSTSPAPGDEGVPLGVAALSPPRTSLRQAGVVLAPTMTVANLLGYAFNVVASRWLLPEQFGALGALLGLALIAGVPALALQPVVARHTAVHAGHPSELASVWRTLVVAAAGIGAVSAGVAALSAPLTAQYLHLDSPWPVIWLGLQLGTLPLVAAYQGMLQGVERFHALAAVLVTAAATRLAFGAAFVSFGWGVSGALAGTAVGSALTTALAAFLVGSTSVTRSALPRLRGELTHAAVAMAALLVMANIDVPLARHYLPAVDSGLYAVGAVVAKGMFWGPQFVVVLLFPRLANDERRRQLAMRAAVGLAAVAAVGVAVVAVAARPVLEAVVGPEYGPLARDAWMFAALGGSLALVQLLLYARLAQEDRRITKVVALVAAVEVLAIVGWWHSSVREIVATALAGAAVLVAVGLVGARQPARRTAAVTS